MAEISCAKINPAANVNTACLLGCGISTGWGAVFNTCKVKPNTTAVVFGLGAVGLAVVQALKEAGCRMIVGVDINDNKAEIAKKLGVTDFVNPTKLEKD